MSTGRLEEFSDGVLAILITIMVLELKPPEGSTCAALRALWPVFVSYVLSFVYLGIHWNNHHHLLQATRQVNGLILWANLDLLSRLSLFPFTTAWMGEHHFATVPVAVHGAVSLLATLAYHDLQSATVRSNGCDSALAAALGSDLSRTLLRGGAAGVRQPLDRVGAVRVRGAHVAGAGSLPGVDRGRGGRARLSAPVRSA